MALVSTIPLDVLQSSGAAASATEACIYDSGEEQVVFQYPRTAESFEKAVTIVTTTAENAWWASIQFELPPPPQASKVAASIVSVEADPWSEGAIARRERELLETPSDVKSVIEAISEAASSSSAPNAVVEFPPVKDYGSDAKAVLGLDIFHSCKP